MFRQCLLKNVGKKRAFRHATLRTNHHLHFSSMSILSSFEQSLMKTNFMTHKIGYHQIPERLVSQNHSRRPFHSSNICQKDIVGAERSIEDQYSRKTPLEHILLRPGMYVGAAERTQPSPNWIPEPLPASPPPELVPDFKKKNDSLQFMLPLKELPIQDSSRMVQKKTPCYPALIKIFDEILVNAFDNRLRNDPKQSTTQIDVIIHPGTPSSRGRAAKLPYISITNNGKGIPIQIHKKENMLLPELLFGHLLTGSNFDDTNQKKVTGGRHGYGAKLTNIFSKEFEVETVDMVRKKRYRQKWEDNMKIVHRPKIEDLNSSNLSPGDFTRVSFTPDLTRLAKGYETKNIIPPEDYAIMCRRVFDVAGCSGGSLTVTLNGEVLPIKSFQDYAHLYRNRSSENQLSKIMFQRLNARWEIGVGLSNGSFESMSFVNGMDTLRGGTHVNAVVQQVSKKIADKVSKDYPDLKQTVTQTLVRRHLSIFVNSLIENPSFDSQMKEYLTSSPSTYGSRHTLTDKFLNELVADESSGGPGIVEQVTRSAQGSQQATLLRHVGGKQKTKRHLLSIPKLDDAHLAGSDQGKNCSLILTEGDSAKALAVGGLEVIGRKLYGVFPLRGKFLNVRNATVTQLTANKEVKALCSIIGLDFEKTYETQAERDELRYGHIMLMTDQDADGSHIKGLVINFFRHFWPNLLMPAAGNVDGKPFLSSFITPLMKATKKKGKKKDTKAFFSMADYDIWRSGLQENEIKQWNIKYYKGLGTSTQTEAKEYFNEFSKHNRTFKWEGDEDGNSLDMAFEKDRVSDRRDWLMNYDATDVLEDPFGNVATHLSYEKFINKELIHFSNADNIRSLPSVIDGLKPSQRKVLYSCFKRNLKNEIKVAQLTGYCAEHSAYHHGEASLHSTITGMAQDFVGSNNLNLLEPGGQFGTRMAGGKDAASPRYIFTRLSPLSRLLFPDMDDDLLHHLEDDGQLIEPKFYCPIIPLLLVNGSQGIGTGWSTFIPQHDVRDVLEYVRAKLDGGQTFPEIKPWARGFTGKLEVKSDKSGYRTIGNIDKKTKRSVVISELPVGKWTNDYKNHLVAMQKKAEIDSFIENHTTTTVSFTVFMKSVQLNRMMGLGLERAFRLNGNLPLTNMNAFDANLKIQKYESPEEMVDDYFPVRLQLYHDRKQALECSKEYTAKLTRNKAEFIEQVVGGRIDLVSGNKTKQDTILELEEIGFSKSSSLQKILYESKSSTSNKHTSSPGEADSEDAENDNDVADGSKQYDYLLNMPISSLTSDRIDSLRAEAEKTDSELHEVQQTTPENLWHTDLEKLDNYLKTKMKL